MTTTRRLLLAAGAVFAAAMVASFLLLVLGGRVLAAPDTLCVAPGGSGCDPGVCGGTCYASVQSAVSAADPGDEILVAAGVYTRGGASLVVYINESITVRGGYTTTNWLVSHPVTQVTTLDGEGQVGVVYISGDVTPTLEGLWLTNGQADDGGGIYARYAHPVISGCHIFSNVATFNGGGIRLRDSPTATLTNNRVYSNTAGNGGGIYLGSSAGATLTGNEIYSNTSLHDGGGLTLGGSGLGSVLVDNDFSNNTAYDDGGGINIISSDGATLIDNRFYSNTAGITGGGLVIGQSDDVLLLRNKICSNTATSSAGGGLILFSGQNTRLINTLIAENRVFGDEGAGLFAVNTDVHLLHTTLARNSGWSGVYASGVATVWMTNTILVSHTVGVEAGHSQSAINLEGTLWGAGEWANGVDVHITSGSVDVGAVNVRGDPAFIAPDSGDYHIGLGSAAVDRGIDAGVTDDIDGGSRPIGRPDLGMDEWGMRIHMPLVLRGH